MNIAQKEFDILWAAVEKAKQDRAEKMPDQTTALHSMFSAFLRLKEMGWRDAMYCPKDGTRFLALEAGSTGQFLTWYDGVWPNGRWWAEDGGDIWPAHPILFKLITSKRPAQSARREE